MDIRDMIKLSRGEDCIDLNTHCISCMAKGVLGSDGKQICHRDTSEALPLIAAYCREYLSKMFTPEELMEKLL